MLTRILGSLLVGVVGVCSTAAAEVRISMADGAVTVSAKDATVREILTDWGRVGQTRIVNIELSAGARRSIELVDVPEAKALDIILRTVSGYIAASRTTSVPNGSIYDRIILVVDGTGTGAQTVEAVPAAPDLSGSSPSGNEAEEPRAP